MRGLIRLEVALFGVANLGTLHEDPLSKLTPFFLQSPGHHSGLVGDLVVEQFVFCRVCDTFCLQSC